MVERGDIAPAFELQGVHEGKIDTYTLEELTEDGPLLIGVYVYDFSPVCTRQMCTIQDMDWYQYKKGLSIVGVCTDGPYSHMAFAEQEEIGYPLLCDTAGEMLDAYGVLNDKKDGLKNVPRRAVFLIGQDETIRYRWVAEDNWDEDSNYGLNPVQEAISHM